MVSNSTCTATPLRMGWRVRWRTTLPTRASVWPSHKTPATAPGARLPASPGWHRRHRLAPTHGDGDRGGGAAAAAAAAAVVGLAGVVAAAAAAEMEEVLVTVARRSSFAQN